MYNKYLTEPEVWDSTKQYKHIAIPEALPVGMNLVSIPTVIYQGVTYFAEDKKPAIGVTPNTIGSGWTKIAAGGSGGGDVDSVNGQTGTVNLTTDDIPEGSTNKYLNQTALDAKYDKTGGAISGNVHVSRAENSGTVALFVTNTDNTNGDSSAQIKVTTAGDNAGDPYATFTTYGVADWSAGFNNQSGNFEIARANNLGNNTCLTIDGNSNVDFPAGTVSVSRDPQTGKEVATKAYIDSRTFDEGVNLLEIDADTTLTEIFSLLPVSTSVDGVKVLLPSMDYIRQKLSVGQTFQVLNVDFDTNSFDLCYADGTLIQTLAPLQGIEIVIQKDTTQGNDIFPYPNILFMLSRTRNELGGLVRIIPDDIFDDVEEGETHLVHVSNSTLGQVLVSQGPDKKPQFVSIDIPSSTIESFTPMDDSGANLTFGNIKAHYYTVGKKIFVNMTFTFPATTSTATAKISGLPSAFNSILAHQLGSCLVVSGTIAVDCLYSGIPGTTGGYIVIQGAPTKNNVLAESTVSITIEYLTD